MGLMAANKRQDLVSRAAEIHEDMEGYRLLAMEIIVQAVMDTRRLRKEGKRETVINAQRISEWELDNFFSSGWCTCLLIGTAYTPEEVRAWA